ncbi:MAG TPA: radical SAM protein [Candidatus Woesearchaeota archaeon]|nr:radical SAM protein [Candidatus Woesearchaeota archaeon]
MAVLSFQDLEFVEGEDKVKVFFLRIYYFYLLKSDLSRIAGFVIRKNSIEFKCSERKAINKFNQLLGKGLRELVCIINKQRTVYVHKNSGIPLIGTGVFGLVDRNTNCIEVKPLTACNLDCVFCSVDAGLSTKKRTGYVVEKDYLIEEFNKLVKKKKNPVEAHIGPQGEPLLYAPLLELIKDLRRNPKVKVVSIDTNGTLLSKKLVDELVSAGVTRLNISLNALDKEKCRFLAGTTYNLNHLLEIIDYASKRISVLIAPVIIPGLNDEELEGLIRTGMRIRNNLNSSFPVLGIQNFLNYKRGRNPVKQRTWDEFFNMLKPFEKIAGIKLRLCREDFGIRPDVRLEKPFKRKQVVKARIVCEGPLLGEKIGVYRNRAIIVEKAERVPLNSCVKVRIIRDKHNIYRGVKQ